MKSLAVILWLLVLVAMAVLTGAVLVPRYRRQAEQPPAAHTARDVQDLNWQVGTFTLTDKAGQPFDTAPLKGRPYLVSFFFSNCPGPCILLNQAINRLIDEMPDSTTPILSITVDPRNDTPERLTEYARIIKATSPRWHMLTGDQQEIERIAEQEFHVSAGQAAHTERVALVGGDGKIVGFFSPMDEADRARLREKLAELEGHDA